MKTTTLPRPRSEALDAKPSHISPARAAQAKEFSDQEVRRIRLSAGMTQSVFAFCLGVSVKTVEAWESGRNAPSGGARRLLEMLEREPTLFARYGIVETAESRGR